VFFKVSQNVNNFLVIADNAIEKFCILPYLLALKFQSAEFGYCIVIFAFFRITNLSTPLKTTQIMFMM